MEEEEGAEAGVEEEEGAEAGVEEEQQPAARPQEEEEGTQNSSERNHLPSMEIAKTLTDSFQTFKDICP